ncbi:MAG: hypothetical protein AAGH90_01295 [Pseudomonadota bacterium]
MRLILLLILYIITVCAANSEGDRGLPIVYLAEINSFEYRQSQSLQEIERDGEILTFISTGCGSYKAEFEIIKSRVPLPEIIEVSGTIGEWCKLDFAWPYDLYLINAEGEPNNAVEVIPASFDEWLAYTQLPTSFWNEDFTSWLGPELVAALEPKLLAEPHRLYLHELPRDILEAFSCSDDELEDACAADQSEMRAFEQIITFDGPIATIHKAIQLNDLFPELAEE